MSDLHDKVTSRLAELRAVAQAATRGPWRCDDPTHTYVEAIYGGEHDDVAVISGGRWGGEASVFESTEDAVHIVTWNPAFSLPLIEWAEEVARRHGPGTDCEGDCYEYRGLAGALDIYASEPPTHTTEERP